MAIRHDEIPAGAPNSLMHASTATRNAIIVGGIVLAVILSYAPALRGGFIWDDDDHVTSNRAVQTAAGLRDIWFTSGATPQYYPLVFSSFWLEHRLWGLAPLGYHVDNVLLHALNAVLAWLVLRRLSMPGALLAATLFALHPINVESVAWITERKNVLSAAFYLGALLAYLHFAGLGTAAPNRLKRRTACYGLALMLFTGALLSKTVTCTLPAVILLLVWWKRDRLTLRALLPLVPMFAIGIGMGLVTIAVEREQIGARGVEWSFSFVERILIAGRALWFYLGKIVWPTRLAFWYTRWDIDAGQWVQFAYPAAFAGLLAALWALRARVGKGPLVAALVFAGTLFPALGFFNIYPMRFSFVADHFQYLAGLAPIALLAALAERVGPRRVRVLLAAVLLATLATLTWRQARVYESYESLLRDSLKKNPGFWLAHQNLGGVLEQQGRFDEAMVHWNQVLRLKTDAHLAHTNLGVLYEKRLAQPRKAVEHYQAAIDLAPSAPAPLNNLAWLLATHPDASLRDGQRAVRLAEQAARLTESRHVVVLATLSAAYAEAGRFQEAIRVARHTLGLIEDGSHPELAEALRGRIRLFEQGRPYREPR